MDKKDKYVHYVKKAEAKPEYPACLEHVLIRTIKECEKLLEKDVKFVAFDIETNGLSPEEHFIVGYSLAFNNSTGYYIPVKHFKEPSLGRDALDICYKILCKASKVFMYNARFDMRFMHYAGYDMSKVDYYDVSIGVWLADTNKKMPSLKWASSHFLGWSQRKFSETVGDNPDYYYLDPENEEVYGYAADDAMSTFAVCEVTLKYYKEARYSGKLLNTVLYPLMIFENEPLKIDVDYLKDMEFKTTKLLEQMKLDIYALVGYEFNINSNKQLGQALQDLGINTGIYTATGAMSVSISSLEEVSRKKEHPLLKLLVNYSKTTKRMNSYISPLILEAEKRDNKLRFSYFTNNVPTTRLSCGRDAKNPFFAKINEQSIPKPTPCNWYVEKYDGNELLENDEVILGWRFSLEKKSKKVIEGFNPADNIRKAFILEDDEWWVSVDFSGQELRAMANMSKEPVWSDAFLNGDDVHKATAISLWGLENYDKSKRKKAKSANFGISYGMSAKGFKSQFHLDTLEEAEDFVNRFRSSLSKLSDWMKYLEQTARQNGVVYNPFGLPRRLEYYYNHKDFSQKALGLRLTTNTVVQSAGADILRMALLRVYNNVLNNEDYKKDCRFLSTIHDEINYAVKDCRLKEIVRLLNDNMTLKIKGWDVPMEVGLEIGRNWGSTFKFKFLPNGELIPEYEEIEE